MADTNLEHLLDEWARAWSAHDIDKLVALFTDGSFDEDVASKPKSWMAAPGRVMISSLAVAQFLGTTLSVV